MIIYPTGVPALRFRDFYRLNISENVLFLAVFDEDSGNSRSYAAKQFVAYRSDEVGCMVDRGARRKFRQSRPLPRRLSALPGYP